MKKPIRRLLALVLAAALAGLFGSCKFPYEPTSFVLPQKPQDSTNTYRFPDKAALSSFLGTSDAKVVFTLNDNGHRTVYYVDFNDSTPVPRKLRLPAPGNIGADSPLLSPDGTFVAYALLQGNNVYGAYVQRLDTNAVPVLVDANGTEPQWYRNSSTGDLYIIYSTLSCIQSTDTIGPGLGVTCRKRITLGGTSGATFGAVDTLAPYPMNGGLSANGEYLCTGYQPAAFYNVQAHKLTMINQGHQVCNPSIDPDVAHPDRMMFLNFGGAQSLNPESGTGFPGNASLVEHAVIFIVDVTNTVQNHLPIDLMGSGYGVWQCPQWSNVPAYAAALAASDDFAATWDLVLIDIDTKQVLKMTLGNGKLNGNSTPSLWVGN